MEGGSSMRTLCKECGRTVGAQSMKGGPGEEGDNLSAFLTCNAAELLAPAEAWGRKGAGERWPGHYQHTLQNAQQNNICAEEEKWESDFIA